MHYLPRPLQQQQQQRQSELTIIAICNFIECVVCCVMCMCCKHILSTRRFMFFFISRWFVSNSSCACAKKQRNCLPAPRSKKWRNEKKNHYCNSNSNRTMPPMKYFRLEIKQIKTHRDPIQKSDAVVEIHEKQLEYMRYRMANGEWID